MTSKLYEKPSLKIWYVEKLKNFFEKNSLVRISTSNKLTDYKALLNNNDKTLWQLHCDIHDVLEDSLQNYGSYDYGNGYFYQSCKKIGVSGYRNTELRIEQLNLEERLMGKSVLDIGTNTAFILCSVYGSFKNAVGIDINPYLIQIGNLVKDYLEQDNLTLLNIKFEDFAKITTAKFDVVLSLANHSTFDGNTDQTITQYFSNIAQLLNEGGRLIFESHPPEIEPKDKLNQTLGALSKYFDVVERPKVSMPNFLDKNRTYVICERNNILEVKNP